MDIRFDTSQFDQGMLNLQVKATEATDEGIFKVANEVLRLSQFEVPHDIGTLQNSGHVEKEADGHSVGYNTRYARRLHEHPEYNFQKGRKGKYLEDPIKNNLDTFLKLLGNSVKTQLGT